MKITSMVIVTGLLGLMSGCQPPQNQNIKSGETLQHYPTHFTVGLTQLNDRGEWKPVPIHQGRATLAARPFRMVFFMEKPSELIVQASTNAAIQQAAKEGANLNALLPAHAAIAEPLKNPKRRLWISDGAYQSWMVLSDTAHRFDDNGVESLPNGGLLARRTVENIADGETSTSVNDMGGKTLYLLIVQAEKHPETGKLTEKQREWLTLDFQPAPTAAATQPAKTADEQPRPLTN